MKRNIFEYRREIVETVIGVLLGLVFIYTSNYISSSNNIVDGYVPGLLAFGALVLFFLNRKWTSVGLLASYAIFWLILVIRLQFACEAGSCL